MNHLKKTDPKIWKTIQDEVRRQQNTLELIASENFTSCAVLEAHASVLTNKYAEGYPGARWYGGCRFVDEAEQLAIDRAKKLFKAEHANVQPHSGSQANMAVYFAALKTGDAILAMDLACGGHLTHGLSHNFSGRFFKVATYGLNRKTETLDYDEISAKAKKYKPKMIVAGASAYPRVIDFKKLRQICDSVGAYLFVDMAHIAGLVAAGIHPSPVSYAEFVSSTTHKTLRGPRGGFILCRKEFAKAIDAQVFPGIQGGPLMHVIAAKAVCFKEATNASFRVYQKQVVSNAKAIAGELSRRNYRIVSGGTDTHLLLVDLENKNITGQDASKILEEAGITVNKNLIPFDRESPSVTSGIRIGSAAVTTRGMKTQQMKEIAQFIDTVIKNRNKKAVINQTKGKVSRILKKFPLYPEMKVGLCKENP